MKEILFANVSVITLVFALGYGLAVYLTPKKLQPYLFWLAPWFAIVAIGVVLTVASLTGVPGKYGAPAITIGLLGFSLIAWIREPHYQLKLGRDGILVVVMILSIVLNQSPLIRGQKLLTLVSFGNNDALVYAAGPDYLREHTILENLVLNRQEGKYDYEGVQNLIQNPYRWGTPVIISYFLTITGLEGYQLSYTFQVLLFGLMIPLSYIFFVLIFGREQLVGLLLTAGLASLNANTLYMVYHNFAGQVLFWGIELFFLINLFSYLPTLMRLKPGLLLPDFVLGATLAALYFSYHEGALFLLAPLAVFGGLTVLAREWKLLPLYFQAFGKIGLVTLGLSSLAVVHGVFYDFRQSKLVLGPIGWQVFRDKLPFANPFEMTGLWSIHTMPPLPTIIAVGLSLLTVAIFGYGIIRSKHPRLLSSYVLIYFLMALWVSVLHPNFFAYNRVITYILPVLTPILVTGFLFATENFQRLRLATMLLALSLAAYFGVSLNIKFLRNNLAADRSLISLSELANNEQVDKTIYLDDLYTHNGNFWRQAWTSYFLYPQKEVISTLNPQVPSTGIPDDGLVLISKSPWYSHGNLLLQKVVWENGFYRLGTVCMSDECLLKRNEDLSTITFGESSYADTLLSGGWAQDEGNHRWANESTASARLVSGQTAPTKLTFRAHSLQTPQQISIVVDGKTVATISLPTTFTTFTIPLTPQANHVYHISFTFSHGYTPGGGDSRTLYGNFSKLGLE